jgi:SAM-dependent methyltransferase
MLSTPLLSLTLSSLYLRQTLTSHPPLAFHHFDDVIHAAKCLKERLRPGGVLVISEFLEGGDLKADENGAPIEGSTGDHTGHIHTHHGHGHGHHANTEGHDHGSGHGHHHHAKGNLVPEGPYTPSIRKSDKNVVVPHFTIEGVKEFFTEAGFVDVDVWEMEEKVYMEFAGM